MIYNRYMKTIKSKLKEISKELNMPLIPSNSDHIIMENLFDKDLDCLKDAILKHVPDAELEVKKMFGDENGGLYSIIDSNGLRREEKEKLELLRVYEEIIDWTKKELNINDKVKIYSHFYYSDSGIEASVKDPVLGELKDYKIREDYILKFNMKYKNIISIFHEMVHVNQYEKGYYISYLHNKRESHPYYRTGFIWKGKNYTSHYHKFRKKEAKLFRDLKKHDSLGLKRTDKLNNRIDKMQEMYEDLPWENEAYKLEKVLFNKFMSSISEEKKRYYSKYFKDIKETKVLLI